MNLTQADRKKLRGEMLRVAQVALVRAGLPVGYSGPGWRLDVTQEPDGSVTANLQSDRLFLAENSGAGATEDSVADMLVNVVDSFAQKYA